MPTAAELLASACTSGISCLNEKNLLVAIAQGASAGGGGGGGGGGTLSTDGTFAANSDLLYPSQKAAKTYVDAAQAAAIASSNATSDSLYVKKAGDTMTGALLLPGGAVGAPALSRSGDTNTGLWYPAADTIAFSTAGAERVRIDSVGLVGIGITAPLARLHVTPAASGTDYFRIDHSDGTPRFQFGAYPGATSNGTIWLGNVVPSNTNSALFSDGADTILSAVSNVYLAIAGSGKWFVPTTGHLLAVTDNTYDIGASGATRPRNVYVAGSGFFSTNVRVGSGSAFYWEGSSIIYAPSDGVIRIANNAETDFNRLQLGGTTSAFPSIKRNSAGLDFRLADDSGYADITANRVIANAPVRLKTYTVATLPAGTAGDMAYVTDSLAPAFLVVVAGGGAVVTPVFYNGTNWITA